MKDHTQLRKQIRGVPVYAKDQIVEINGPSERTDLNSLYFFFLNMPEHASVFLIRRYNFDIKKISRCEFLTFEKSEEKVSISMRERPDLKISFLSAHKSKGLQADYVLIINCRNTVLGFPSRMKENDVYNMVREIAIQRLEQRKTNKKICGKFSEERRLFYVAMTRARKRILFLTIQEKESPSITLIKDFKKAYFLDALDLKVAVTRFLASF